MHPRYLLNGFDSSQPLHLDVREVLRQQLGDRLLPFVIRRSPAVSEALAEGMTVMDYAPETAVAGDVQNLASWLRTQAAPAAGFRKGGERAMTRSPLAELESAKSLPPGASGFSIIAGGTLFLIAAAAVPLPWPHQAMLGGLLVLSALWLHRGSGSYLTTLMLVLLSCFATLRYGIWRIHWVERYFRFRECELASAGCILCRSRSHFWCSGRRACLAKRSSSGFDDALPRGRSVQNRTTPPTWRYSRSCRIELASRSFC